MGIDRNMKTFVWVAGIAIPVVVAVMFFLPGIEVSPEMEAVLHTLPAVNATINGTAFLCLALFLLSYVSYHITTPSTPFCKEGWIRGVYFVVLLTHILLSIVIVPLVLTTYLLGLGNQIQRHRKWARITWPIWMYVTFTGVVVYLLISPCYPF